MTEPGVSPTAIEIAAKAIMKHVNRSSQKPGLIDKLEASAVIRALVDSGELVVPGGTPVVHFVNELKAQVTRLEAESQRRKWAMERGQLRDEQDQATIDGLRAEVERLGAENERLRTVHAVNEDERSESQRLSQALRDCVEEAESACAYVDAYFMEKWEYAKAWERARAVLGESVQEGPSNMVRVTVPRTGRPDDVYWVRLDVQEGER